MRQTSNRIDDEVSVLWNFAWLNEPIWSVEMGISVGIRTWSVELHRVIEGVARRDWRAGINDDLQ